MDGLDSFYSSILDANDGIVQDIESLIDVYTNTQFNAEDIEKLLETHKAIRENGDDIAGEIEPEPDEPDENEDLYKSIKESCGKALEKLKDEISRFNSKKDTLQEKIAFNDCLIFTQRENTTRLKNIMMSNLVQQNESQIKACEDVIAMTDAYFKDIQTTLTEDINTVRKDVSDSKKTIRNLLSALSLPKSLAVATLQCPICMTEKVKIFCDPCGHTYCSKCLKSTHCYICRTKVKKMNSLFFN
jgi:chromosome segregation ATPase